MKQTHFSNPSGLDEEDEEIYQQLKKWRCFIIIVAKILFNQIVKTKEYKRLDGKGYWHNKIVF